jgi:hypothetical protein
MTGIMMSHRRDIFGPPLSKKSSILILSNLPEIFQANPNIISGQELKRNGE